MKRLLMIIGAVTFLASPITGQAGTIGIGDSWPTNSWAQTFQEDGNYYGTHYSNIYKFVAVMTSGGTSFEVLPSGGMSNFSVAGWGSVTSAVPPTLNSVTATGTGTGYITWNFNFTGLSSDTFAFDVFAYTSTGQEFVNHITYNGSGNWQYSYHAVPEPGTLLLLGSGLLGFALAGFRKKFRK